MALRWPRGTPVGGEDWRSRPLCADLAPVHHEHVRHALRDLFGGGCHDDDLDLPFQEVGDKAAQPGAEVLVETREGIVQDQNVRRGQHRLGDLNAPPLSVGELVEATMEQGAEFEPRDDLAVPRLERGIVFVCEFPGRGGRHLKRAAAAAACTDHNRLAGEEIGYGWRGYLDRGVPSSLMKERRAAGPLVEGHVSNGAPQTPAVDGPGRLQEMVADRAIRSVTGREKPSPCQRCHEQRLARPRWPEDRPPLARVKGPAEMPADDVTVSLQREIPDRDQRRRAAVILAVDRCSPCGMGVHLSAPASRYNSGATRSQTSSRNSRSSPAKGASACESISSSPSTVSSRRMGTTISAKTSGLHER